MRTQRADTAMKHLSNSRRIFLDLLELVRSLDKQKVQQLVDERDYEELEMVILNHLMGR